MTPSCTLGEKRRRQQGAALVIVAILGVGLLMLTAVSVQTSQALGVFVSTQEEEWLVREIAESAAAQAVARIKSGGFNDPVSGSGSTASWVPFGQGEMYYYTQYDNVYDVSIVRAWGRVAMSESPSGSSVSPDDLTWDGSGYALAGVELSIVGSRYVPLAPLYTGNGGIERPLGGFDWGAAGVDPFDPTTWTPATSQISYQASTVPFECNALDHAPDYLSNPQPPAPPTTNPHPYKPWVSQNQIGQFNTEAWFANSAGASNPMSNVFPDVSTYYSSDPTSPGYAFPVDSGIRDVQDFGWSLWSKYNGDPTATLLSEGAHSGTYGTYSNPGVTFVTGQLTVPAGQTFSGTGILVIRDEYDPNYDLDNTPSARGGLNVEGNFEWTGLVIVSGWAPDVRVKSGASATIVGSLFGEDSVQSNLETSLDSSMIVFQIEDSLRLLYSHDLFKAGGIINSLLPPVSKRIVGARTL